MTLEENKAAEERARTNGRVVGRKAIRRQSPFSCPKTSTERRGLRPRVASRNKWRRIELLQANQRFQRFYRAAYERRRSGSVDVEFPYGTYQLRAVNPGRVPAGPWSLPHRIGGRMRLPRDHRQAHARHRCHRRVSSVWMGVEMLTSRRLRVE